MSNGKLESWIKNEKSKVTEYLEHEGVRNPNIGEWPAFEAFPYFAIWVVESKKIPGNIGWWAFSGDCPTDYISNESEMNPRIALGRIIEKWNDYAKTLKIEIQPIEIKI